MTKDPVCGMQIDEQKAAGKTDYQGVTYYFRSQGCQKQFQSQPHQYASTSRKPAGVPHEHGRH